MNDNNIDYHPPQSFRFIKQFQNILQVGTLIFINTKRIIKFKVFTAVVGSVPCLAYIKAGIIYFQIKA